MKTSNVQNRLTLMQGIKLAELGVMNAVGSSKTNYFRNLNQIINVMPVNLMGIPWYKLKDYIDKNETYIGRKKKDRKFLDRLAADKHYLESIIVKVSPRPEKSKTGNTKLATTNLATKKIVYEAQTALNFLEERREFWSQQIPDYPNKNIREKQIETEKHDNTYTQTNIHNGNEDCIV